MKKSEDFLSLLRTKSHYHCLKVKYKERKGKDPILKNSQKIALLSETIMQMLFLDVLQPQEDLLVLANNVFKECAGWDYNGDVLPTIYPHLSTSVSFLGSQYSLI